MHTPSLVLGSIALLLVTFRYLSYVLLRRERAAARIPHREDASLPTVHVIVPCFNEGEHIWNTVASLAASDLPAHRLRITVVDDCSVDDSRLWIRRAARAFGCATIFQPTNQGKKAAILRALDDVSEEIVLLVDSDVTVAPDAIRRLLTAFDDPRVGGACGLTRVANHEEGWLPRFQAAEYYINFEVVKSCESRFGTVICLSGCFTAYRTATLRDLAPAWRDERIFGRPYPGEDRALTRLALAAGHRTVYVGEAIAETNVPTTLRQFLRQRVRWTRSFLTVGARATLHLWRRPLLGALQFYLTIAVAWMAPFVLWHRLLTHATLSPGAALRWALAICMILGLHQIVCLVTGGLPRRWKYALAILPGLAYWPFVGLLLVPYAAITFRDTRWMTRAVPALAGERVAADNATAAST